MNSRTALKLALAIEPMSRNRSGDLRIRSSFSYRADLGRMMGGGMGLVHGCGGGGVGSWGGSGSFVISTIKNGGCCGDLPRSKTIVTRRLRRRPASFCAGT